MRKFFFFLDESPNGVPNISASCNSIWPIRAPLHCANSFPGRSIWRISNAVVLEAKLSGILVIQPVNDRGGSMIDLGPSINTDKSTPL